jgi:hypothetical protein
METERPDIQELNKNEYVLAEIPYTENHSQYFD